VHGNDDDNHSTANGGKLVESVVSIDNIKEQALAQCSALQKKSMGKAVNIGRSTIGKNEFEPIYTFGARDIYRVTRSNVITNILPMFGGTIVGGREKKTE